MPSKYSKPLTIVHPAFNGLETSGYLAATDGQVHDPYNSNPLIEGEFLDLFSSSADTGKLARASATVATPFLYVSQRGRTDSQSTKQGDIALENPLVIKTKLVDGSSSLVAGDEVMVGNVTIESLTKAGLVKQDGSSGNFKIGRVLKAGTNSGAPDGSFWEIFLYRQPILIP